MKVIEWNLVPTSPTGIAAADRVWQAVFAALAEREPRAAPAHVVDARRHACTVLVANLMAARRAGLIVPVHIAKKPTRYVRVQRYALERVLQTLQAARLAPRFPGVSRAARMSLDGPVATAQAAAGHGEPEG